MATSRAASPAGWFGFCWLFLLFLRKTSFCLEISTSAVCLVSFPRGGETGCAQESLSVATVEMSHHHILLP